MKKALRIFAVTLILSTGIVKLAAIDGPEPMPTCDPRDPTCQLPPPPAV